MMANWLVMIDPPRHTPIRAIHECVFSNELFGSCELVIETVITDLLTVAAARGGFDAAADFAERIPVYVVNGLLGVPRADWEPFVAWSRAICQTTEPLLSHDMLREGAQAREQMAEYFAPLIRQRRGDPGGDVLSGLLHAESGGVRLTEDELLDCLVFLYQAGHPTGGQLIALAVHSLLRHPDQLAVLRSDPGLLPGAVEELQRFDGPVQMNDRIVLEDVELFGVQLRAGELVRLCVAAANRDGERYPDPHRLDLTRAVDGQLGYGHGLHSCVAAELGRRQVRRALAGLLEHAPRLRLSGEPQFVRSMSNRALSALPVEF